jgi:hypothetical protein
LSQAPHPFGKGGFGALLDAIDRADLCPARIRIAGTRSSGSGGFRAHLSGKSTHESNGQ